MDRDKRLKEILFYYRKIFQGCVQCNADIECNDCIEQETDKAITEIKSCFQLDREKIYKLIRPQVPRMFRNKVHRIIKELALEEADVWKELGDQK